MLFTLAGERPQSIAIPLPGRVQFYGGRCVAEVAGSAATTTTTQKEVQHQHHHQHRRHYWVPPASETATTATSPPYHPPRASYSNKGDTPLLYEVREYASSDHRPVPI